MAVELPDIRFTESTMIGAEGARVGVANCSECGAAILLDPRDAENQIAVHADFHRRLAEAGVANRATP